ncbi:IRE4 [Symbiodinium microadriaticum]|nr:IRE4 [Symbiodinium microadriaticum]
MQGVNPFGSADTDETKLFSSISSYQDGSLPFTDATPAAARSLIHSLLISNPAERIGYTCSATVFSHAFFSEVDWKRIASSRQQSYNLDNAVDSTMVFINEEQETFRNAVFDQY